MTSQKIRSASAAGALLSMSVIGMNPAIAEPWDFTANIGAVSNYMWRGVSQTGDQPAIQGGLDVAHESGFSAGTWVSNVDFASGANYEIDLYAGYDFTLPVEGASLGLSTTYYAYPDDDLSIDFWEIAIGGGYSFVSAGIAYTVYGGDDNDGALFDQGDLYYSLGLDFPLPKDFGFGVYGGYYDFTNDDVEVGVDDMGFAITESADYWHWGATITKDAGDFGSFNFTYDQNGGKKEIYDDDPKFWVGWNKEF